MSDPGGAGLPGPACFQVLALTPSPRDVMGPFRHFLLSPFSLPSNLSDSKPQLGTPAHSTLLEQRLFFSLASRW